MSTPPSMATRVFGDRVDAPALEYGGATRRFGAAPTPKRIARGDFVSTERLYPAASNAVRKGELEWAVLEREMGLPKDSFRRLAEVKWIRYDRAVMLVRALGLDPVDFDV